MQGWVGWKKRWTTKLKHFSKSDCHGAEYVCFARSHYLKNCAGEPSIPWQYLVRSIIGGWAQCHPPREATVGVTQRINEVNWIRIISSTTTLRHFWESETALPSWGRIRTSAWSKVARAPLRLRQSKHLTPHDIRAWALHSNSSYAPSCLIYPHIVGLITISKFKPSQRCRSS